MASQESFSAVTLIQQQELRVSFDLGDYRLIPGYQGEAGMPLEAFLALYAVQDSQIAATIGAPGDLSPFIVSIADAAQALEFVQLFTSPATYRLFSKRETLVDVVIIGDTQPAQIGALAQTKAQTLSIHEPHARMVDDHFLIERCLVRATSISGPRVLLRRSEQVTRGGQYMLLEETPLAQLSASEILLPHSE